MPLQETSGNATVDAYGGGVAAVPQYIEDVFSTYLYTGNNAAQGIANGINLGTNYGGSGYFDGYGFVTAPASSSFVFTGDYTIETWVYITSLANNGNIFATWTGPGGGPTTSFQFNFESTGTVYCADQPTPAGVITVNNWIHVAASRSGTTQKIFINGVVQSTATVSGTVSQASTVYIGKRLDNNNYVVGYFSNLRVVNGTAVYTSNFTPSTVPLTAISGTVLLTCQANGFVDASTNAFTITNTNAVALTNYGPFTSTTAGAGGLVWQKSRNTTAGYQHVLYDTARGSTSALFSSLNNSAVTSGGTYTTTFNASGFTTNTSGGNINQNGFNQVSWTFRKQPKFFDVVTYTGNDTTSGRAIPHNLGSTPGFVIIKNLTTASDWTVWHRSLTSGNFIVLNTTAAQTSAGAATKFGNGSTTVDPTSTDVTVGGSYYVNAAGYNYVMYVFAHNAGGFGLTGTDNVISCGSVSATSGTTTTVNLGYEPQWILFKASSVAGYDWFMLDTMRGLVAPGATGKSLAANTSGAETTMPNPSLNLTSTGFTVDGTYWGTGDFIYIAIRRGPMKTPTVGTTVFSPVAQTNTGSRPFPVTSGFPVDSAWFGQRSGWGVNFITSDRLRGATNLLLTTATTSESYNNSTYGPSTSKLDSNTQFFDGMTNASEPDIYWMFKRAPGYFDEVCYTGTNSSSAQNITHNLGVVPELMIVKGRSGVKIWGVYTATTGNTGYLTLNATDAFATGSLTWDNTSPTSSQFTAGTYFNSSTQTFVAYLFATCAGVSKVGSYTGNGTTQTIDCGLTAGARFVLIKRTDATGDWYVYDTARGMTTLTDPYLFMNSTAAEVATLGSVTTVSTGFALNSTILAAINVSGGSYIFLAIA